MKLGVFLPVSGKVAAGGGEVLADVGQIRPAKHLLPRPN